MEELENVEFIHGDIRDTVVLNQLKKACGEGRIIDTLISDMAHPFTGSKSTDVARVHDLVRFALHVADMPQILKSNGNFVAKYLNGEGEDELRESLSGRFKQLHSFKPKSSRSSSTESFFVGIGFKPPRR
jgi:23S rRNA (uridine2552-2'-O)-methyltransferase